jgi:xylulokinase
MGVCVATLGPCLLPTDAPEHPLRPAILYGIDTRARAEIESLGRQLTNEAMLQRCDSPLSAHSLGPKILRRSRNEPEIAARTRRWFTASSYLVRKPTGEWMLDHRTASQCGPMYDVHTSAWIDEWAAIGPQGYRCRDCRRPMVARRSPGRG